MCKIKTLTIATIFIAALTSCKSIKLIPSAPIPVPQELKTRLYLDKIGTTANNLQDLPGRLMIFYKNGNKLDYYITLEKFMDSTAKVRSIDKPIIRYQSTLDQSSGAYLSYVVGNLDYSSERSYQTLITDASGVVLDNNDKQRKQIETADIQKQIEKVYYITGATLVTIQNKAYTKYTSKGAVSGYAINLNGNYYYSSSEFALDYKVGLDFYDVSYFNFKKASKDTSIVNQEIDFNTENVLQSMDGDVISSGHISADVISEAAIEEKKNKIITNKSVIDVINKYSLKQLQEVVNNSPNQIKEIIIKK